MGGGEDIVLALSDRLSGRICNGFSDFIVILQEYVHAYEDGSHQVWVLAPTENRVMALFYFQIYI